MKFKVALTTVAALVASVLLGAVAPASAVSTASADTSLSILHTYGVYDRFTNNNSGWWDNLGGEDTQQTSKIAPKLSAGNLAYSQYSDTNNLILNVQANNASAQVTNIKINGVGYNQYMENLYYDDCYYQPWDDINNEPAGPCEAGSDWDENSNGDYNASRTDNVVAFPMAAGAAHKVYLEIAYDKATKIEVTVANGSDSATYSLNVFQRVTPDVQLLSVSPNKGGTQGGDHVVLTIKNLPHYNEVEEDGAYYLWRSTGCYVNDVYFGAIGVYSYGTNDWYDQWIDPNTGHTKLLVEVGETGGYDSNGDWYEGTPNVSDVNITVRCENNYERNLTAAQIEANFSSNTRTNYNMQAGWYWDNDNSQYPYGDNSYFRSENNYSQINDAYEFLPLSVTSVDAPSVFTGNTVVDVNGVGMNFGAWDDASLVAKLVDEEAEYEQELKPWNYTGNTNVKFRVSSDPDDMEGYEGSNLKFMILDCNDECDYDNPLYEKSVTWKTPVPTDVTISPAFDSLKGGKTVKVKGKFLDTYGWASVYFGDNYADWDYEKYYDDKFWSVYDACDYEYYARFNNTFKDCTTGTDVMYLVVPEGVTPGKTDVTLENRYGSSLARTKFIYGDKPEITSIAPATVATTGGSTITLIGKNFGLSGTPTVTIGGEKSPFVVRLSSTKVTAVVPAHAAGPVEVALLSSNGGGGTTTAATLTYGATGTAPAITKITPATSVKAGGGEAVITGTGFGAAGTPGVLVGGKHAKVTASSATSITIEVPEGDDLGPVSVVVNSTANTKTKASALTYVAPAGITSIDPAVIASYSATTDSNTTKALTINGSGFGATGVVKFGDAATCSVTTCFAYTGSNGSVINSKINLAVTEAGSETVTVYPGKAAADVNATAKGLAGAVTITGPSITSVSTADAVVTEWWEVDSDIVTQNADIDKGNSVGIAQEVSTSGGIKLAVTGKGFGSTAGTLKVGTTTVSVADGDWTDTRIEFTAPALTAGDYAVTVLPVHGLAQAQRNPALHVVGTIVPPRIVTVLSDEENDVYFDPEDAAFSDGFTLTGTGFLGTDNGASTVVAIHGDDQSCGETFDIFYDCTDDGGDSAYNITPASFTDTTMSIKAPRAAGNDWSGNEYRWLNLYIKTNVGTYQLDQGIYYYQKSNVPAPTISMHTSGASGGQGDGYGTCVTAASSQGQSLGLTAAGYGTSSTFTFASSDANTWATSGASVHPVVTMTDGTDSVVLTNTDVDGNENTSFTATIPDSATWTNPWGVKKVVVSNLTNGIQEFNFTCKVKPVVDTTVAAVSSTGGGTSVGTHTMEAAAVAGTPPTLNFSRGTTNNGGWLGSDTMTPAAGVNGYEWANMQGFTGAGRWTRGLPDSVSTQSNPYYYVRVSATNPDAVVYDTERYLLPTIGKVKLTLTGTDITITPTLLGTSPQVYNGKNYGVLDGQNGTTNTFGYTTSVPVSGNSAITKVVYEFRDAACTSDLWTPGVPKNVKLTDGTCNGSGTTPATYEVRVRSFEMTSSGSNYARFYVVTKGAPVSYQITPRSVGATIAKPTKYYDGSDQIKLEVSELLPIEGNANSGVVPGDSLRLSNESMGTFLPADPIAAADAGNHDVEFSTLELVPAGLAVNYTLVAPASPIPGVIKKSTALLGLSTDKKVIRSIAPKTEAQLTLSLKDLYSGRDLSSETMGALTYTSTTPGKCSIDPQTLIVTAVDNASGQCIIGVSQAASANFTVAKSALDDSLTTELLPIMVVGAVKTPVVVVDDVQVSVVEANDSGIDPTAQFVGLLLEDDSVEGLTFTITKNGDNSWTYGNDWVIGNYTITASGGAVTSEFPSNYTNDGNTLSYVAGKLAVTAVPPTIAAITPPQGPEAGGTTVTISGTDFDGVSAITIGDLVLRAPKFTFVNGTGDELDTLTFRTPAGYGTADVILKSGTLTAEDSFKYVAPEDVNAKITSISPKKGPNEGGSKITITGTHLELVTSIKIGPDQLFAADFKVNSEGTEITFFSPGGSGVDTITLVTDKGTDPTSSFTYIADAAPDLDLALDLEVGAKLNGAKAELKGGGLLSESSYTLQMFSTVVTIYTGTTDANGNFRQFVTMPKKACVEGGRHKLVLKGIDPDGKAVTSIQYLALSDDCLVLALSKDKPLTKASFSGFLFDYNSAKLTKKAKRSLRLLASSLTGAKTITIYGYTQTDLKSAAAKAANKKLGKARAKAVKAYLKKLGVKAKYVTVGRGAVKPVSTKKQKKNRRVVIVAKYLL